MLSTKDSSMKNKNASRIDSLKKNLQLVSYHWLLTMPMAEYNLVNNKDSLLRTPHKKLS